MRNLIFVLLFLAGCHSSLNKGLPTNNQVRFYEKDQSNSMMFLPVYGVVNSERGITIFHNIDPELRKELLDTLHDDGVVRLLENFDQFFRPNQYERVVLVKPQVGEILAGRISLLSGETVYVEVEVIKDNPRVHQTAVIVLPTPKSHRLERGFSGTLLTCINSNRKEISQGVFGREFGGGYYLYFGPPKEKILAHLVQ